MKKVTIVILTLFGVGCLMTPSVLQAIPGDVSSQIRCDLLARPVDWPPHITVTEEVYTVCEDIPYGYILVPDHDMKFGRCREISPGEPGEREITIRTRTVDGDVTEMETIHEEILKRPIDRVAKVGLGVSWPIEKLLRVTSLFDMEATAYDPGYESNGKWTGLPTAYGLEVGYGVVAVDPKVIPLGTMLFIEGYGYAIAGDTGGAIKKMRIDLGYNTRPEALRFGRRDVKVYCIDT